MHRLQRLTSSILPARQCVYVPARTLWLSPRFQMPSFSGKEATYSSELDVDQLLKLDPKNQYRQEALTPQQQSEAVKQARMDNGSTPDNPSSWMDDTAFRPLGSNSEEMVAADRSKVDPLHHGNKETVIDDNIKDSTDADTRL